MHHFATRQPEMEADDRRLLLEQHLEHGVMTDEALVDFPQRLWWPGIELGETRRQMIEPVGFTSSVAVGGAMAEQVDVDGPFVSSRVARICSLARSTPQAPRPSEPNPPTSVTAAASAGVETPAMGAWMIG